MYVFERTDKSGHSFRFHTEHDNFLADLGILIRLDVAQHLSQLSFSPITKWPYHAFFSIKINVSISIYNQLISAVSRGSHSLFRILIPTMTTPPVFSAKWLIKSSGKLITVIVFLILDFLDNFFCIVFRILDECFEGKASPCYCEKKGEMVGDDELQLSETLYGRKNVFREMGFLGFARIWENSKKRGGVVGGEVVVNRWSDCGCESCVSWMKNGDHQKLHVVVREPSKGNLRIPPFVNFPLIN